MRTAFEKAFGKIEDDQDPGRYFMGEKLEEVQNNDPRLERLEIVVPREEGEDEFMIPEFDKEGRLRIKKGAAKETSPPAGPEQLRHRYELIANVWLYAKMRHPGRQWLQDHDRETYRDTITYILGSKVMGLTIEVEDDRANIIKVQPTWKTIMGYEKQIRKKAYELVLDGDDHGSTFTLKAALFAACRHSETRSLYFITPLTFQAKKTAEGNENRGIKRGFAAVEHSPPWDLSPWNKGKYKVGTGTKGKGSAPRELHRKTMDGIPICFKYNNENENCAGDCGMVHCCQICLAGAKQAERAHPKTFHATKGKGKGKGKTK